MIYIYIYILLYIYIYVCVCECVYTRGCLCVSFCIKTVVKKPKTQKIEAWHTYLGKPQVVYFKRFFFFLILHPFCLRAENKLLYCLSYIFPVLHVIYWYIEVDV
jgi:hypothetical protein